MRSLSYLAGSSEALKSSGTSPGPSSAPLPSLTTAINDFEAAGLKIDFEDR